MRTPLVALRIALRVGKKPIDIIFETSEGAKTAGALQ
jgi:hypothetical protein